MPSDKRQAAWRFDAMLLGLVRSCANSVYLWILRQADPVEGEGKGGTKPFMGGFDPSLLPMLILPSSLLYVKRRKKKKREIYFSVLFCTSSTPAVKTNTVLATEKSNFYLIKH
jgi:hypothetical protein